MSTRLTGKVKWFDQKKGFGIITETAAETDAEYFIHYSEINTKNDNFKYLKETEEVEFQVGTDKNGRKCAKKVTGCGDVQLICENPVYQKHNNN